MLQGWAGVLPGTLRGNQLAEEVRPGGKLFVVAQTECSISHKHLDAIGLQCSQDAIDSACCETAWAIAAHEPFECK